MFLLFQGGIFRFQPVSFRGSNLSFTCKSGAAGNMSLRPEISEFPRLRKVFQLTSSFVKTVALHAAKLSLTHATITSLTHAYVTYTCKGFRVGFRGGVSGWGFGVGS